MAKLSDTQSDVLRVLRANGGKIIRRSGGFWTYPDCSNHHKVGFHDVPEWYTKTQTIRSMETKGLLVRTHEYAEEWRDSRELTQDGRTVDIG